jgi:ERCC4-related helicase
MHQGRILERFKRGTINILFATSIAEEGLDIQHCSLVICYDIPARPLSVVQTVGRARARDAKVLFMQAVDEQTGFQDRVRQTLWLSPGTPSALLVVNAVLLHVRPSTTSS